MSSPISTGLGRSAQRIGAHRNGVPAFGTDTAAPFAARAVIGAGIGR